MKYLENLTVFLPACLPCMRLGIPVRRRKWRRKRLVHVGRYVIPGPEFFSLPLVIPWLYTVVCASFKICHLDSVAGGMRNLECCYRGDVLDCRVF